MKESKNLSCLIIFQQNYVKTSFVLICSNVVFQAGIMIRVDGDHWIKTVSTIMYITSVKPVLLFI